MENTINPESNIPQEPLLTDKEVFSYIWFSPRKILKFINDTRYEKYMIVLLCLGGMSRAFDRAAYKNMGNQLSLVTIILVCVIAGGLFGWIWTYLYSALVSWTGKWLKGKGDTRSIVRIIAYAQLPNILSMLLLIPLIIGYGNDVFRSDLDLTGDNETVNSVLYMINLLDIVLAVWTIVLSVIGISEVQKLSVGKSILNILLPAFAIIVPLILIALLFRAL